jgi:hypothetical protein
MFVFILKSYSKLCLICQSFETSFVFENKNCVCEECAWDLLFDSRDIFNCYCFDCKKIHKDTYIGHNRLNIIGIIYNYLLCE